MSWFVSVEWFLCLNLSGLSLDRAAVRAGGPGVDRVRFTVLALLIRPRVGLDITYDWGIVRGIADFAIGVSLAILYRNARARGDALSVHWHSLAQILAFAALFVAIYNTGWSHTVRDYWLLPPMFAIIFALAFDRGIVARLFQSAPLRVLGSGHSRSIWGRPPSCRCCAWPSEQLYPNPAPGWAHTELHLLEPAALLILCVAWGGPCSTTQ